MKIFNTLAVAGLLLVVAAGCSSTADKESMLTAAGFQRISADTPQRQQHLRSLPPDQITQVQRNGANYYTFPDPKQNVLYVGQEPQFQEYQRLRYQDQIAMQEQLNIARADQDFTWWGVWGPMDEPFFAVQ